MLRKILSLTVIVCFFLMTLGPLPQAHAGFLNLPVPGTMVNLSPAYEPVMIKGLTVHKDNPFLFDFIVDTGHSSLTGDRLKMEADRLVRYFLACLTIPEKDLWVNLSPYEKDRMVPQALGQTALGRDLLSEDYILKQLTASLIYPEKNLGKAFWGSVYAKAREEFGTTQIPVNTFNKVWIVADKATVYEHGQTVFVIDGHLKVMLEEDYLALQKHQGQQGNHLNVQQASHALASNIVRSIILPEIEKEVNSGKNFSALRQIFNSLILASWYKKNLKEALLNQVYADKSKINGNIANGARQSGKQIYEQYLKAYKKGVFNYVKEDTQADGQTIPRKYFSGGFVSNLSGRIEVIRDGTTPKAQAMIVRAIKQSGLLFAIAVFLSSSPLYAQTHDVTSSRGAKSYTMSSSDNNTGMDSEQLKRALENLLKTFHQWKGVIGPRGTSLILKVKENGFVGTSTLPNVVTIIANGNTLIVIDLAKGRQSTRIFNFSKDHFERVVSHAMVTDLATHGVKPNASAAMISNSPGFWEFMGQIAWQLRARREGFLHNGIINSYQGLIGRTDMNGYSQEFLRQLSNELNVPIAYRVDISFSSQDINIVGIRKTLEKSFKLGRRSSLDPYFLEKLGVRDPQDLEQITAGQFATMLNNFIDDPKPFGDIFHWHVISERKGYKLHNFKVRVQLTPAQESNAKRDYIEDRFRGSLTSNKWVNFEWVIAPLFATKFEKEFKGLYASTKNSSAAMVTEQGIRETIDGLFDSKIFEEQMAAWSFLDLAKGKININGIPYQQVSILQDHGLLDESNNIPEPVKRVAGNFDAAMVMHNVFNRTYLQNRPRLRTVLKPKAAQPAKVTLKVIASKGADRAALAPGGIDLNTTNGMQWKDSKDGNGVEMNVDPAMIVRARRDGLKSLSPVILRMTRVTSIWPLVGLQTPGG